MCLNVMLMTQTCVHYHTRRKNSTFCLKEEKKIFQPLPLLRQPMFCTCYCFSRPTTCEAWQSLWTLRPVSSTSATNTPRSCRNSWPGLCICSTNSSTKGSTSFNLVFSSLYRTEVQLFQEQYLFPAVVGPNVIIFWFKMWIDGDPLFKKWENGSWELTQQ